MTDDEIIKLAVLMREAQKRYFCDRTQSNLVASKQAESAFDKAIIQRAAGVGK